MTSAGKVVAVTLMSLFLLSGCSKKEEPRQSSHPVGSPHAAGEKKQMGVVVPPSVAAKWKAVKIVFTDKTSGEEIEITVPIRGEATIPRSDLSIRVDNFLPDFIIQGTTLTSRSDELKNPAAQVIVLQKGTPIFTGWLYAKFPTTHAFQHPKYGFRLVDFVGTH